MPRGPRPQSSTGYYHWINRGVNQKKLFHSKSDFERFLDLIKEYKERFQLSLFHYRTIFSPNLPLILKCLNPPRSGKFYTKNMSIKTESMKILLMKGL